MAAVRGGNYEPRLLRVTGVRGMGSFQVIWLRSWQEPPDLFYRFPDPDFRGTTSVELDRVYNARELLTAARTHAGAGSVSGGIARRARLSNSCRESAELVTLLCATENLCKPTDEGCAARSATFTVTIMVMSGAVRARPSTQIDVSAPSSLPPQALTRHSIDGMATRARPAK
jgi:hypothetical protein